MATTPKTVKTYTLNGSLKDFTIPFEYLARKFVVVTLIGATRVELVLNVGFRFSTPTTITTLRGSAWGPADNFDLIEIRRFTSATERLVDFADGSILRAYDLNTSQVQSLHIAEEARDLTADTIGVNNDGNLDARARRIVNLGDAIDPGDAVTLRQEQAWGASALNQAGISTAQAVLSQASRVASEAARDASVAAKNSSEASNVSSQAWSSKAEDSVVSGGLYSSYHYSRKSSASAATATTQAGLATTNGAAQVALAAAQVALATTQAGLATTNGAAQVALATTQAGNSANSASASQTSRLASEAARDLTLTYRDAASASATAAAGSAAGVNMPNASGNALKMIRQNASATGFEYIPQYSDYGHGSTCPAILTGDATTVRPNGLYSVALAVTTIPVGGMGGTMEVAFHSDTNFGSLKFITWTGRTFTKTRNNGTWTGWIESLASGQGTFAGGGLTEVGRYLDLHYDASAIDFSGRISSENSTNITYTAGASSNGTHYFTGTSQEFINTDSDSRYMFRAGRLDACNQANSAWRNMFLRAAGFIIANGSGTSLMTIDGNGAASIPGTLATGSLSTTNGVSAGGNVAAAYWHVSNNSGGKMAMSTGNTIEFHWNAGCYYRIDANTWVLINTASSDRSLKDIEGDTTKAEAGDIIDQLAEKSVKFSYKQNTQLALPEGSRYGFIAQETAPILPGLFKEAGMPGANTDDATFLTFNEDAPYQLISLLVKTVGDLRARVAALESK